MKNLETLVLRAVEECEAVGIEVGYISDITINSRAKTRWGRCHKLPEGNYEIEISSRLLNDEVSDNATMSTVVHEVLHTCEDCMNHGNLWKSYAERMNNVYGYNIQRTTSSEEKNIERTYKHTLVCDNCGKEYHKHIMTKTFRYIRDFPHSKYYACGHCHQHTLRYVEQ